jgi:hypothetical protein
MLAWRLRELPEEIAQTKAYLDELSERDRGDDEEHAACK